MELRVKTNSEAETEAVGAALGRTVRDGAVLALYGDLGAGKTALVRGLARGMGIDVRVQSPTFTIVNEYAGARELVHFDMYRLKNADELFDIGWEDYVNRNAVCAVEWSENVREAFDGSEISVKIDVLSEEVERVVKLLPTWTPGSHGGKNVAVQCYVFVEFQICNTKGQTLNNHP